MCDMLERAWFTLGFVIILEEFMVFDFSILEEVIGQMSFFHEVVLYSMTFGDSSLLMYTSKF